MESVVTRARMFKHKPDGDVTFMKLRDKNGVPVPVFQDPMHYPHGTKFLAPGTSLALISRGLLTHFRATRSRLSIKSARTQV